MAAAGAREPLFLPRFIRAAAFFFFFFVSFTVSQFLFTDDVQIAAKETMAVFELERWAP